MDPDKVSSTIKRIAADIISSDSPRRTRVAYHVKKLATQLYIGSLASSLFEKMAEVESRIQEAPESPEVDEAKQAVDLVKEDLAQMSEPESPVEDPATRIMTLLEKFDEDFGVLCAALSEMDQDMIESLPELQNFCNDMSDTMKAKLGEFQRISDMASDEDKEPLSIEFMEEQATQEPLDEPEYQQD